MKVIYQTQWQPTDEYKDYPHGWGFVPPFIEFPQNADPVECSKFCKANLSKNGFECIGAYPRELLMAENLTQGTNT